MPVVNSTDEGLKRNELNFKMLATVPVFPAPSGAPLVSLQNRYMKPLPVINQMQLDCHSVHRAVTIPGDFHEENHLPCLGDTTFSEPSEGKGAVELKEVRNVGKLNSHTQGILLLLTHHMRRLAVEYHAGYHYLEAFLGDLDNFESVRSAGHQRLLTLDRMRSVHYFLQ
ncbi:hypothetical protein TraAM80_01086 [Trypanosoma rangeli]|uniref:Uncharacterized protein n=1 Tax=Trypanosoma rangeli TaxID=5698 RepID=A0A422P0A5_TRYRA|nr:uncharacterized protein TraAM80_01086 [Trypanosoma rangeli]RNF11119.1 hypothetical protein TraAM80_01086 [Trypanosoma rangeli]|eukprot:RNF11119.1 hypothetical protein TraAM80_01086 [Trypanosoma rangeli]